VRPHQIVRQLVPFAAAALACSLAIAPALGADDASGAWKALAEGGAVAHGRGLFAKAAIAQGEIVAVKA